jgi:hypothetical protein
MCIFEDVIAQEDEQQHQQHQQHEEEEEEEVSNFEEWLLESTPNGKLSDDCLSLVKFSPEKKWDCDTCGTVGWFSGVHQVEQNKIFVCCIFIFIIIEQNKMCV